MQDDKNIKKKGMRAELKKVIWPTGKQTVKSTFVTIAFVLIISLALVVLNLVFGKLNDIWLGAIIGEETVIDSNVNSNKEETDLDNTNSSVISGEVLSGEEETSGEVISGE